MRNNSTSSTAFVMMVAAFIAIGHGLVAPSAVTASTLFSDDFQNAWPPDWTPKWNANDLSKNGLRSDPDDSDNLVLKLYGEPNWSASATRAVEFPADFVLSLKVWNGTEPRRPGWGRGSAALEHVTTLFTFYSGGTYPDGTLNLGGIELPYETERWYDIRVRYQQNGGNPKGKYWLDGVYVGETQFTIPNPGVAPTRLELNGGSTAYFDNVSVVSVPEPAGLLLAILGAAGALCVTRVVAKRRCRAVQLGSTRQAEGRDLHNRVVQVPFVGPVTLPGSPVQSGLTGKWGDASGRRQVAFCRGARRPAMVRC